MLKLLYSGVLSNRWETQQGSCAGIYISSGRIKQQCSVIQIWGICLTFDVN